MKKIISGLVAFASLLMNGTAQANVNDLINLKFSANTLNFPYTGSGVGISGAGIGGTSSQYWNNALPDVNAAKAVSLSSSLASTVKFLYSADATASMTINQQAFSGADANLMRGYIWTDDQHTFTFSGLDKGATYNLTVYTQAEKNSIGQKLALSANGAPMTSTIGSDGTKTSFINGQNYITISAVANSLGVINVAFQPSVINGTTNKAIINAMQLLQKTNTPVPGPSPVPEPASMVLIGIGGLLASRRLKKSPATCEKVIV